MVQRKSRKSRWVVTGTLAKLAGKGYIVTNVRRSRGRVLPAKKAIRRSNVRGVSAKRLMRNIDRIALKCAAVLSRRYSKIRMIGLDVGVDRKGKVWVIEANFKPMLELFKKLKDKKAYLRILRYAR